jgi:hypothetical protein
LDTTKPDINILIDIQDPEDFNPESDVSSEDDDDKKNEKKTKCSLPPLESMMWSPRSVQLEDSLICIRESPNAIDLPPCKE